MAHFYWWVVVVIGATQAVCTHVVIAHSAKNSVRFAGFLTTDVTWCHTGIADDGVVAFIGAGGEAHGCTLFAVGRPAIQATLVVKGADPQGTLVTLFELAHAQVGISTTASMDELVHVLSFTLDRKYRSTRKQGWRFGAR